MSTLAIGGSRLRPLPILKITAANPANRRIPFLTYSTLVNHGVVSGGNGSGQFSLGSVVTSSSGGVGVVVATTPTSVQLNPLAGTLTFNPGDTLTQQTGSNSGATATQAGASSVVGPFTVGDTVQSSLNGVAKATGTILQVNANDILVTGLNGSPAIQGSFDNGDTLTQLTGAAAGATTVQSGAAVLDGLLAAQTISLTYDLSNYINGRVRGNFRQDVAGTLDVYYGNDPTNMDLDFTVPQDTDQPEFQYPFDIIVIQPYCRLTFVNGGGPGSYLRAFVSALPV